MKLRVSPTVETLGVSIARNANGYALGETMSFTNSETVGVNTARNTNGYALGKTMSFTNSETLEL